MQPHPFATSTLLASALLLGLTSCASDGGPDQVVVIDGTLPATTVAEEVSVPTDTGPPQTLGQPLGPPTLSVTSSVSTVGIDSVHFGMERSEAEQAAGTPFILASGDAGADCYVVSLEEGPPGLELLIRDGRVERLDINEPGVTTRSGAGIGSSITEITELFGDQVHYEELGAGAGRLTFVPTDPNDRDYRIIFDTADEQVTTYRAGRLPDVETGCSG